MKKKSILVIFCFAFILLFASLANTYKVIVGAETVPEECSDCYVEESDKFTETELIQPALLIQPAVAVSQSNRLELPDTEINHDFSLSIPAINLNKEITSEVDPRYENIYIPVLENNIAHGMFTLLPDKAVESGNVYLFAHREGFVNGKDIGFFRRLNEVKKGDKAFIEYHGKVYEYNYRESKIVSPDDTFVYTAQAVTPTLTMQTCNNGTAERLIVWWDLVSVRSI